MKNFLIVLLSITSFYAQSQLEDGSIAPDFTLTDWYGETRNLYSYLDNDKTVFLEIFAAHCPGCWSYHQTNRLKNIYNDYGPDGTNEIMVLALEHDQYNGELAFTGIGDPWNTQGNWLEGTPYPQFNVEGSDRSVFTDYNVTFYPIIYKICPDKTIERVHTNLTEVDLYEKVQNCQIAEITENNNSINYKYDSNSKLLLIESSDEILTISVLDLSGKMVKKNSLNKSGSVNLSSLQQGVYIINISSRSGSISKKMKLF